MLLTVDLPEAEKYLVHDCDGNIVPYVMSFDTVTEEIELMIRVKAKTEDEKEPLKVLMQKIEKEDGTTASAPIAVKFKLPGAYACKDGKPIEE